MVSTASLFGFAKASASQMLDFPFQIPLMKKYRLRRELGYHRDISQVLRFRPTSINKDIGDQDTDHRTERMPPKPPVCTLWGTENTGARARALP